MSLGQKGVVAMTKILIVDDSPVDRQLAGRLVERRPGITASDRHTGLTAIYASNGREALDVIELEHPEVVVTDLQMPEMNGLELVQQIRATHPSIPVVLMTAHGSEDIAIRALKVGAASYVPKRESARDLLETVESVLEAAQTKRGHDRLMGFLTRTESQFVLDNDLALIPPLIAHLKENLAVMGGCDETMLLRVSVALREAVLNAIDHGNLELDSRMREESEVNYHRLGEERRQQAPYRDRRVHVMARETPAEAVYVIRDEGPGFDPSRLPDPLDPANLESASGRGLLLIRTFMTEVRHNATGNEITLIRRA
jgi:CheY-like chemotaxis protein/anti-sigma regulatory factor (Ser/Thr protein kinase)